MVAIIAAAAAACAPTRASLGDISLRPYTAPGRSPTTYGVQEGRVISGSVDVAMDPDGCLRGTVGDGNFLVLCPKEVKGAPNEEGGQLKRWAGLGGDLVTEVSADGAQLRVDGSFAGPKRTYQIHSTLLFQKGPQWDELRKHPALYAIAAAVTGVDGEPTELQRQAVEDLTK